MFAFERTELFIGLGIAALAVLFVVAVLFLKTRF